MDSSSVYYTYMHCLVGGEDLPLDGKQGEIRVKRKIPSVITRTPSLKERTDPCVHL